MKTATLISFRHNDLADVYRKRVENHVDEINLRTNVDLQWGPSNTDIPRMRGGLLGGQVLAAITHEERGCEFCCVL